MVAKLPNDGCRVTIGSRAAVSAPSPPDIGWEVPPGKLFRCEVRLAPEPDGGFSVYAPELPGVVSEGENEAEAIQNISEALQGALAVYLDDQGRVPWKRGAEASVENEARRWIVVNV